MRIVRFTACNGRPVFVNAENVFIVYVDSDGDTVIRGDSGAKVYVNCDIETAVDRLQICPNNNLVDSTPTVKTIPIAWIKSQIGRMKVKGSPWVVMAIESLVKAWEQENKHGESEIPSDTRL